MTLREVVDLSLLAKSIPDENTTKKNMDFLQNAAQKMEKPDQQKMQAIIDGMKKTELFTKAQKEEQEKQEKQKKIQQTQKPESNTETTAQLQNTNSTAQSGSTSKTAQLGTN